MSAHDTRSIDRRIDACLDAGASPLFLAVLAVDPHTVGVDRNLVRQKVRVALEPPLNDDTALERIRNTVQRGGHYFQAVWEGDLAEALYRADGTNRKILIRTFPYEYLLAVLAADRGGVGSARSWLDFYVDRYGWPDQQEKISAHEDCK